MSRLLFFPFLFTLLNSIAQQPNWSIEAKWRSGFLLAHRSVMGHLAQEHSHGLELIVSKRMSGKKLWHQIYGNPTINLHLFYGGVGNRAILGNYLGLYNSIEFPIMQKNNWRLNLIWGAGLGFTTKVYDKTENPKNVAMSSPVFAIINPGINTKYTFKKNTIGLGIDILHFSNGSTKLPNLGLNLPYINLSYARVLNTQDTIHVSQKTSYTPRKIFYGLTMTGAFKQVYPTSSPIYPVFTLNLHARTILKPKMGWELAIDIISKQSIKGFRPEIDKTQWRMLQIGVYAGYILPLDRFHYLFGVGYYLKDYYKVDEPIYLKIGGRYYFNNGLHAQLALKTHYGKADYIELGFGYSFNYSKNAN